MAEERNRGKAIYDKLKIAQLPFKLKKEDINEFGRDAAANFNFILEDVDRPILKWCMSTIKKAKVFTLIYYANENNLPIYKEDIAKKLTEYSYKTIATIVDEGVEKGYFVPMDPIHQNISDKKIKNIRPSLQVITDFYNWNIARVSRIEKIIQKYKSSI